MRYQVNIMRAIQGMNHRRIKIIQYSALLVLISSATEAYRTIDGAALLRRFYIAI